MTTKLLAEWFWVDRWTHSSAFLLPLAARGLYREMLSQSWARGAKLPNDPEAIRRATGTTAEEWAASWPRIKKYWRAEGDCLVNDTQLQVFKQAQARSTHAQAAAFARHTAQGRNGRPSKRRAAG
jgi:uncharacterized protein YdaU (DUF1376 family)